MLRRPFRAALVMGGESDSEKQGPVPGPEKRSPAAAGEGGLPSPAPAAVRAHDPTPEELRRIAEEVTRAFPPRRTGTELVLMEIDPRRAHAYWHVEAADYDHAVRGADEAQPPLVVRMYDISGIQFDGQNARDSFDVQVQGLQGHWYVDLFAEGRTYTAELGLRRADGSLVRLARANTIRTPASRESPYYENVPVHTGNGKPHEPSVEDVLGQAARRQEEALAGLERQNMPGAPAEGGFPMMAGADQEAVAEAVAESAGESPASPDDETKTVIEIPLGWPSAEALVAGTPVAQGEGGQGLQEAESGREGEAAAEGLDEGVAAATEPPGSAKPDWPSAEDAWGGLPAVTEAPAQYRDLEQNTEAITQADEAARRDATGGAPADVSTGPLPLENYLTYSSGESGRKDVWLEINTELHIYGRASPNSELTLFGQKVQTRPDGTFSIRKPLPQGAVVIPLLFSEGQPNGSPSAP